MPPSNRDQLGSNEERSAPRCVQYEMFGYLIDEPIVHPRLPPKSIALLENKTDLYVARSIQDSSGSGGSGVNHAEARQSAWSFASDLRMMTNGEYMNRSDGRSLRDTKTVATALSCSNELGICPTSVRFCFSSLLSRHSRTQND